MRKSVNKEQKQEKSVVSVKKILIISMVVFAIMGMMGVMASNTQAKNVKIILASGYEMNVMTTSTTVSDILDENNIEILDGEIVTPDLNSKLPDNKTIKISTEEKHDETTESYFTEDEILKSYTSIVEKIVTVKEDIPFETITKDISGENGNKQEKVTQVGVNGVKEVTYKIQYQNGNEISKEKISENVIKEPVNKIVEVRTKAVTSRSSSSRAVSGSVAEYQSYASGQIYKITAYCPCAKCCGKATGRTAMGTKATAGRTVAASAQFAFGTKLNINGHTYTVEDRGGAIKGNKIDIFVNSHAEALAWGVRYLPVSVTNQ